MNSSLENTRINIWKKLTHQTKRLGRNLTETILKLYYSAQDEQTPAWARTVIYGALLYFLVPIDAIPDILPTGYSDDLATLLAAVTTVGIHITPAHTSKAHATASRWFNQHQNTDLNREQTTPDTLSINTNVIDSASDNISKG